MRYSIRIALFILLILSVGSIAAQTLRLSGHIVNKEGEAIAYARLSLLELDLKTKTNSQGNFSFDKLQAGVYTLSVESSAYESYLQTIEVKADRELKIILDIKSFRLRNLVVMAKAPKYKSGTRTIHREALEHIQPTSLGDIFQLLPGKLTRDGGLTNVQQISSRQAGADKNTALGTAIYTNGVPISNDATLHRVMGDQKQRNRNTVNGGADLRLISTDHLEQVEVVQGIPSAKYGNLTSGLVITKAKSGASPISLRIKADPNTKLIYAGKGVQLPKQWGSLYLGADYAYSKPSVRETLSQFSRYTGMLNYSNQQNLWGLDFSYGLQLSYIGTFDGQKTDQDLGELINDYRDEYSRISISHNGQINSHAKWLKSLEWNIGYSYTKEKAIRDMIVSTGGTTPLPLSKVSGEFEGEYLPVEYNTQYTLEDKPINLFASLTAKSLYGTDKLKGFVDWGFDYSYDINLGNGYQYDIHRPPFPENPMSSRPRAFKVLPSFQRLSAFVENNLSLNLNEHKLRLQTGFRFSGMPAVNEAYHHLRGKAFFEPRLNLSYQLPAFDFLGEKNKISFRLGYGRGVKYPTLDLLDPALFYRDYKSFDYFALNPKDRYLLITTMKQEAKNYDLKPNINDKYEFEFVYKLGQWRLELLGFYEEDREGFVYQSNFDKLTYNRYKYKGSIGQAVNKKLLKPKPFTRLYEYLLPNNGELVRKVGLEYSLTIPKIKLLQTSAEINGAYYRTYYDVSKPVLYRPDVRLNGKSYPYVGYYGHHRANYKSIFNTNFWFNTHIPQYGLMFTTKLQFVWFYQYQDRYYDGVPEHYFGMDMQKIPFDEEAKKNAELQHLILTKPDIFFAPDRTPLRASLDLKVSKDFGKHIRLAFFVNRLVFHSPYYYDKFGIYDKIRRGPYFGSEINIKI